MLQDACTPSAWPWAAWLLPSHCRPTNETASRQRRGTHAWMALELALQMARSAAMAAAMSR
eukprot:6201805-Pleurochrysis_carterae.AAC.1